jgi:hypothetical protein
MRRGLVIGLLLLSSIPLLIACSGDDDGLDGASRAACDTTWRSSTPGVVVCPGAGDCQCGLPEACCVPTSPTATDVGACSAATSCAALLFACDGPEDCNAGQVCCGKGLGAQCTTDADCFGVDAFVLCHEDAHCESKLGTTCGPADPGTFWDTRLGVCR